MKIALQNDRSITYSAAESRKSVNWKLVQSTVSAFYERLSEPQRSTESLSEYLTFPKSKQDQLKDVGGYVGGKLKGPRRKVDSVLSRCFITLDADSLPANGTDALCQRLDCLGCGYAVYSTRKDRLEAPRKRIVIPADRDMNPEEHNAVARLLAQQIGMRWFDPTTFEANRLMYWPSCCADSPFQFAYKDRPLLSVDAALGSYTWAGGDWHNVALWPKHPDETQKAEHGQKQQDPRKKPGAIGAFCRLYPVERVIAELLPDTYDPVDGATDRYTYRHGSTTGGAIVYDDGLFLQSFHSTDPANGMHNAFDLLRLHKFGHLDESAVTGTPGSQLPSYKAAAEYVKALPDVQDELTKTIAAEAQAAFAPFVEDGELDSSAFEKLALFAGKNICCDAVRTAMQAAGFTVRNNEITGQTEVFGLPSRFSRGNALNTLPVLLKDILKQKPLEIKGVSDQAVIGYIELIADENRFNPVQNMIIKTEWDGHDRISDVFSILGVVLEFDKTLIRKWLVQCVALAFNSEETPIGAEGVLTLQGPQGIGKTELFRRIAVKPDWFVEGLTLDLRVKDSVIRSLSGWITELGELDSTTRKEQSSLKAHVTAAMDSIRLPYAKAAVRRARRSSFCATVNPQTFLTDDSGNRRFWIVETSHIDLERLFSLKPEWFQQLWAQVYLIWETGRDAFRLTREERDQLMARNQKYEVFLPGEEEIRRMLEVGLETIPVEAWLPYTASEIRQRLVWAGAQSTLTPQQVGRALSRISQDFPQIRKSGNPHKRVTYLLPIKKD